MAKAKLGNVKTVVAFILGITLLLLGTITFFSFDAILHSIFLKELVLHPNSESFKIWKNTPVPMQMSFYMYNWTNPEQLGNQIPNLTELGPYRFSIKEDKTDVTWNANGTLTYRIRRQWFFDEPRSEGSLDDKITTLNVIAMSAASTVRNWNMLMRKSLSMSLTTTGQRIFIRQKVGDLLFDGYSDALLNIARTLPAFAGIDIPYDKFGWFYKRNSSSGFEGVFNMDTGERGTADLGKLWRWNFDTETGFYDGACGKAFGSAGELFPPGQSKQKPLHMFSADLCRTIRLDYSEETELQGVKGLRYTGGLWNMDNGTMDPSNQCFCSGECSPAGVVNVTTCRLGAPGFISYPHFLFADPVYRTQVRGMLPDPHKHSLYITLEPRTGIPLDVAARFQINILLSKVDSVSLYQNVPRIYFPMMWFEQRAYISDELAAELRMLLIAPYVAKVVSVIMAVLGFLVIIITTCLIFDPSKKKPVTEEILINETSLKPLIKPADPYLPSNKATPTNHLHNGIVERK